MLSKLQRTSAINPASRKPRIATRGYRNGKDLGTVKSGEHYDKVIVSETGYIAEHEGDRELSPHIKAALKRSEAAKKAAATRARNKAANVANAPSGGRLGLKR